MMKNSKIWHRQLVFHNIFKNNNKKNKKNKKKMSFFRSSSVCTRCHSNIAVGGACCSQCGNNEPKYKDKCDTFPAIVQPFLAATGSTASSTMPLGQLISFPFIKNKLIVPVTFTNDSFRFCVPGSYVYTFISRGITAGVSGTVSAAVNGSLYGFAVPVQPAAQQVLSGVVTVKTNDTFGVALLGTALEPTVINDYTLILSQLLSC